MRGRWSCRAKKEGNRHPAVRYKQDDDGSLLHALTDLIAHKVCSKLQLYDRLRTDGTTIATSRYEQRKMWAKQSPFPKSTSKVAPSLACSDEVL